MLSSLPYFRLINYHGRKALTWISIYRLKGCIEPFVYRAGARFKSHLNEISLGVHRRGKLLTTDLKVVRFSSMRGNVCDKDSGTICCRSSTVIVFTCYQGKVQEGQFDDFPTRYCDIPGTNPVCIIVVGKIGAGNLTTSSINGISRSNASWEKKVSFSYSFGFLLQTKEFQQNRNWKCVSNKHFHYHISSLQPSIGCIGQPSYSVQISFEPDLHTWARHMAKKL